MKRLRMPLLILIGFLFLASAAQAAYEGKVVDAQTKEPVEGALVTLADEVAHTGRDGYFRLECIGETVMLRAPGYARREIAVSELGNPPKEIELTPFKVQGLYLTVYGIASTKLRNAALETIKTNHLNALVIDVKGDRGIIPFKVDIPLAEEIGAQKVILVKDMPGASWPASRSRVSTSSPASWSSRTIPWPPPNRSGPSKRAAGYSGTGKSCAGSIPSAGRSGITTSPSPRPWRSWASMRFSSITSAVPTPRGWCFRSRPTRRPAPGPSPAF